MQTFSRSLPMMLYSTLDAVMPRFRRIFKKFGLTEQQWRVLRVLWEAKSVPFNDLADITLISAPSLVGIIDRLSDNGLVERQRSETDRRMVYVRATEAGQDLEELVRPEVVRVYTDLQSSVDPVVWQQLLNGMDDVIAACRTTEVKEDIRRAAN